MTVRSNRDVMLAVLSDAAVIFVEHVAEHMTIGWPTSK